MKLKLCIPFGLDSFEVIVMNSTITRITKFYSESGMSRELNYEQLPLSVRASLHDKLEALHET